MRSLNGRHPDRLCGIGRLDFSAVRQLAAIFGRGTRRMGHWEEYGSTSFQADMEQHLRKYLAVEPDELAKG
jgi:hypothetical protein